MRLSCLRRACPGWIVRLGGALLLLLGLALSAAAALQTAPAWELKDLTGKTVKLADFKDKVIVLDFWATWCEPCLEEIPGLIDLQKKFADKGLVVVGVALDDVEPAVVARLVGKLRINYPVVMSTAEVAAKYGDVAAYPTTFIIDRQGKIAAGHEGSVDEATLTAELKPLLSGKPAKP